MLRTIPRFPRKATAAELGTRLLDEGFATSRRTIERDLHALSTRFPLVVDDRAKPYGWSWAKDANFEFMPKLTIPQAVALLMAKTHLQPLLPLGMSRDLAPIFDAAHNALAASGWHDWDRRNFVVPATLTLLPPKVNRKVVEDVQHAIARRLQIQAKYRAKGQGEAKEVVIHPLGILSRGPLQYVICTVFDFDDVRQLALNRLSDTKVTTDLRIEPDGFDLVAYATHSFAFTSRGRITLVVRFEEAAAAHLRESPLSRDQLWVELPDGRVEITATVDDNAPLRWWLQAFGSQIEVVSPRAMRSWLSTDLISAICQQNRNLCDGAAPS
jgi:predicted DNA-binding transcriptional regulator YafY